MLLGPRQVPHGEEGQREVVFQGRRAEVERAYPIQRKAGDAGSNGRFVIARFSVAVGEIEQEGRPAVVVEVGGQAADLLEIGQRHIVAPIPRRRARQGHDQPQLEVRFHPKAGPHAVEDVPEQRVGLDDVALGIFRGSEPVAGQCGLRRAPRGFEDRDGLRAGRGRFGTAVQSRKRFREAEEQLRPRLPRHRSLEEFAIPIGRRLPPTRGELEVDLQASPDGRLIRHEPTRRDPETIRDEVQGRHRGLAVSGLEGTDVGLGVAAVGQLLLGQVRGEPRPLDPLADPRRQGGIIDDDAASLPGGAGSGACWR